MSLELKVPSIVCEGCADTITKAIQALDADAQVQVDLATKMVKVEGKPSEEAIKQAIAEKGHTVE
ncbi:MAG: heavy-metal-associated domain-containing protein [Coleofasciculaceae cyanobacterium SM2_3_26]|nr:heavy-metal-associated domain-containing protein [Coleofasciculaceae cyanobacterium SM2_3_26]